MSGPLPRGEDKARTVRVLFDTIAPRYDLVNRVMTLGMDVGWRRRTVRELHLPSGSMVFDLACGTGDLCRELDRAGYRAVGLDFALGMLREARTDAPLVQADALRLPFRDASADGITCGFALRNVVSLPELFAELARVVRPGGSVALLDASRPDNRVLRAGHALPRRPTWWACSVPSGSRRSGGSNSPAGSRSSSSGRVREPVRGRVAAGRAHREAR
ncbi:MAG: methyltransferase domain-containing protein [Actinobacteria bacterium]|nr:MAG: methyltransferase domain-containing protein [Actinomycetota bacterium]